MTARRAFDRRDFFTCHECFDYRVGEDGMPWCRRNGAIRYDPHCFGCGDFATRSRPPERETLFTFGMRKSR